jgi:hypothetical protein
MKTFATPARCLMVAVLISTGAACSSSNNAGGTGGRGTGGSARTGGTTGTGGRGTGGQAGAPTDGGVQDGGVVPSFAYTFDNTALGFTLNTFPPAAPVVNLAAPDSGSAPTVMFDATIGNPNPGSLKVTATYTDYRQYVDVIVGPNPHLNLTGKTIHARVMLVSGDFSTGRASLHASSTGFLYGGGPYTTLAPGVWTDLSFDLTTVTTAGWVASDILQVGIQFLTGDPPEAGTFPGPRDVVFHIDTITDGTGAITTAPVSYTFDTANPGFAYNTGFIPTPPVVNLALPDAGTAPTLVFDDTVGSPLPGSLRASVTFTDYQQIVDVVLGPFPPLNMMGKTLRAKVRLTSGTFGTGAGVILHASTTSMYVYGGGTYTPLTLGTWTDLTLNLSTVTAAMWDPTNVVQIGLQFSTGAPPEAGTFVGPNDVVFHIDTITE